MSENKVLGLEDNLSYRGAPYQQLVTDKDGNAQWEDRLVYNDYIDGVLVETQTVNGNEYFDIIATGKPVVGETYIVTMDGISWECIAWEIPNQYGIYIGNGIFLEMAGYGEDVPFIFIFEWDSQVVYSVADEGGKHTFLIRGLVEITHRLDKKFLSVNLDGVRNFNFSEGADIGITGGAVPSDISPKQPFSLVPTNKPILTELCVSKYGALGFPKILISNLVVYKGDLDLSTFTEQTFHTELNESGNNKLLALDISDTHSKKRFFIEVGTALSGERIGYTETIEKIAPMNGINYLITITGPFEHISGTYTITIKRLGEPQSDIPQ